eukprot:364170-Chlamydomonas_euryale.AAC.2
MRIAMRWLHVQRQPHQKTELLGYLLANAPVRLTAGPPAHGILLSHETAISPICVTSSSLPPHLLQVLAKVKGSELVGLTYEPLFPYFVSRFAGRAFRVLSDGYVTDDSGTGVVHQAPAFGEDDNRVCLAHGVIERGADDVPCPVDLSGRFTDEVPDFAGM